MMMAGRIDGEAIEQALLRASKRMGSRRRAKRAIMSKREREHLDRRAGKRNEQVE